MMPTFSRYSLAIFQDHRPGPQPLLDDEVNRLCGMLSDLAGNLDRLREALLATRYQPMLEDVRADARALTELADALIDDINEFAVSDPKLAAEYARLMEEDEVQAEYA